MLRELKAADILAIKSDLVESDPIWKGITMDHARKMAECGTAFTYTKDGLVVGCVGAIPGEGTFEIWALFSRNFLPITRAKAMIRMFRKLRTMWKAEYAKHKAYFSVPSDLPNGDKYAEFIGSKFLRQEQSRLFDNITDNIYEVI